MKLRKELKNQKLQTGNCVSQMSVYASKIPDEIVNQVNIAQEVLC